MLRCCLSLLLRLSLLLLVGCGDRAAPAGSDLRLSGGTATVFSQTIHAFSQPAPSLSSADTDLFFVGNANFNRNWVTAPASTEALDGLGPLFNAVSCSSCHFKDGRGRPPLDDDDTSPGLLLRLSVPGLDAHGGPLPEPVYGGQLQPSGIQGVSGEARVQIVRETVTGRFDDGETYTLERPLYAITAPAYGPLQDDVLLSPRVAQVMVGLGLLESVAEAELLASADPEDADGDGISGRVNWVWDVRRGQLAVGRFGWKATQPTVEQQVAAAFVGDIGITSTLFPVDECTTAQAACQARPNGGAPELGDDKLSRVTLYSRALAVPARREVSDTYAGDALFHAIGCAACHRSELVTADVATVPGYEAQTIRPYTDLLLHDMGEELADGRPDFGASGSEWRTAPLWGIGLIETVNKHTRLLHDGRARDVSEAILWHGGEADAARARYKALSREERDALVRFINSL